LFVCGALGVIPGGIPMSIPMPLGAPRAGQSTPFWNSRQRPNFASHIEILHPLAGAESCAKKTSAAGPSHHRFACVGQYAVKFTDCRRIETRHTGWWKTHHLQHRQHTPGTRGPKNEPKGELPSYPILSPLGARLFLVSGLPVGPGRLVCAYTIYVGPVHKVGPA